MTIKPQGCRITERQDACENVFPCLWEEDQRKGRDDHIPDAGEMDTPTYPNQRDCEHGHLRRKCEICELERELAEARECLREASTAVEAGVDYYKLSAMAQRWRKAAGMSCENLDGQCGKSWCSCDEKILERNKERNGAD